MSSEEIDDSASWEFDPALPIMFGLSSPSPGLDFDAHIFLGLSYTPPIDDDEEEEEEEEDDMPEFSSGSSTSDISPGTILETPFSLTFTETTDGSPPTVPNFPKEFSQLSPNGELWPAIPSELVSGTSPDTRPVSLSKTSRKGTTKVLVRQRMASDASDSQGSLTEFAGLIPLPSLTKKIRKRIDLKKRDQGNNAFGRKGKLSCGPCRKRNSKCEYSHIWSPCKFCLTKRGIGGPCVKVRGPKSESPYKPITPIDAQIPPEDVLLLEFAYSPQTTSPRTRAFIRLFASQYGPAIKCLSLRHAVLAYAACLLRADGFQERSDDHYGKATLLIGQKLDNPSEIQDGDVFAANLLMWTRSIQNRRQDAVHHAGGIMTMVKVLLETSPMSYLSDVFRVFWPLVFGDATFFVSLGLDSYFTFSDEFTRPITFKERIGYHEEIIRHGESGIQWVDVTLLTIHVSLWDVKRRLLSYLVDVANKGPHAYERWKVDAAVDCVMSDLADEDYQNAVNALEWPDPTQAKSWTLKQELTNYLGLRILTIDIFNKLLKASTIMEGLHSFEAASIARRLLEHGRRHRVPLEGSSACYTWGIVLDLGISGLVFCATDVEEGYLWVFEELEYRRLHSLQNLLVEFWKSPTPEAVTAVINRILIESDQRFESGGPAAKP